MKLNPTKFIKWLVHIPALLLSNIMVIDTLAAMSNELFWKCFFVGCAIFVELYGQFVRGMAAAYRREKKQFQMIACWAMVGVYIGAFAGVSAVGVFMTKVAAEEQRITVAKDDYDIAYGDYVTAKTRLDNKIAAQDLEYRLHNGAGDKYKSLGAEVIQAQEDLAAAKAALSQAGATKTNVAKTRSVFTYMPPWARIPMFIAIMVVIYTALLMTPWPISLKLLYFVDETGYSDTDETSVTANLSSVTNRNFASESVAKTCQYCGKPLPDGVRSDTKFCIDNNGRCRIAAHRRDHGLGGMILPKDEDLLLQKEE